MIASFSQRQCLCHSSFEYQIRFDVHQRGQLVRIEPARLPRLRLKYLGQELLQRAILYCGRAEAEFELVHIQMPPPLGVLPHQVGLGGGFAGTGWAGHQNPESPPGRDAPVCAMLASPQGSATTAGWGQVHP